MTLVATGVFEAQGDTDWFAAELVAGQSYVIEITGADGIAYQITGAIGDIEDFYDEDTYYLYGFAYNIEDEDPEYGVEPGHFTATTTGTVYFGATNLGLTGAYTITLTAVVDDYADNVNSTGAFTGNVATGTVELPSDTDWFGADLIAGRGYAYEITGDGDNVEILIVDDEGRIVHGDDQDDTGTGYFVPTESGRYFFVTLGSSNPSFFEAKDYTLTVQGLTTGGLAVTDDYASNSGTTGVMTFQTNPAGVSVATGSGTFNYQGDSDWFAISLTAGQSYVIGYRTLGADASGEVTIVNAAGELQSYVEAYGYGPLPGTSGYNVPVLFTAATTGTYYVNAHHDNGPAGAYQVTAARVVDDFTDSAVRTGSVTVGGSATGRWEGNGDADWFAVTLAAGQSYTASVVSSTTPAMPFPYYSGETGFYNAAGEYLGQTFTARTAGTYYVQAQGFAYTGGVTEAYSVAVTSYTDDFRANSTTTGGLAVGGNRLARFEVEGDTDWFRVSLTAGQTYSFSIAGTNGVTPDASIVVVNAAGEYLSGPFFTATTSGTYFVAVTGFESAQYRISASTTTDDYADDETTTGEFVEMDDPVNTITGTANNDSLTGTTGNDAINALAGNDRIFASAGSDEIDGGANTDLVEIVIGNTALFGSTTGARTYTITGTSLTDSSGVLDTTMVNVERVRLDLQNAGAFNHVVDASGFTSAFTGEALVILGGAGNNTITGSAGSDFINTGGGNNVIDAGGGFDTVGIGLSAVTRTLTLLEDANGVVSTRWGAQLLNKISNAERIAVGYYGNQGGNQTVDATGISTSVLFYDSTGNDRFLGGRGDDIFGNVGPEPLSAGTDVFTGGGGSDLYDFTFAISGFAGTTITDFDADDVIDLNFNEAANGLPITSYIGNAAFSGVAGQYRSFTQAGQTLVQIDTNGDRVADGTLVIANGEFTLVATENDNGPHALILQAGGTYTVGGDGGPARFTGSALADTIFGGRGDDYLEGAGGDDTLNGGAGIDTMVGGSGDDRFYAAQAGDVVIEAADGGIDTVIAYVDWTLGDHVENLVLSGTAASQGRGNGLANTITGTTRADQLFGFGGDDRLEGGNASDLLNGGAGNDTLVGGVGSDRMIGGAGSDTYWVESAGDVVTEERVAGVDTVISTLDYTLGANVENLSLAQAATRGTGNELGNQITGGSLDDTLLGLAGNDTLTGRGGADVLDGGEGNDVLIGGAARDTLTGGAGGDTFRFGEGEFSTVNAQTGDLITDFVRAQGDKIDLAGIDARTATAAVDDAFAFIGTAAFSGTAGELRQTRLGGVTVIEGDRDGNGVADLYIRLTGVITLNAADFVL